jgi:hypothetical protein
MENVLTDETGFVSFGPYLNASCSKDGSEIDSHGQSHPRIAQIYSSFQGDLCPADGFSVSPLYKGCEYARLISLCGDPR